MVKYLSVLMLIILTACQSTPSPELEPPRRNFTNIEDKHFADSQFSVYDPAEGLNKELYKFNAVLDEYLLLPIVDAYVYVTPEFLRNRVSNFFLNVGEFNNFTNAVLQARVEEAGITLGRFGINTTVGVLGTFDVATDWGLMRQPNDFGKTLGRYGVGPGPYIVIPFLGPSNLRDATGIVADYASLALIIPNDVNDSTAYKVVAYGVQPLDMRYKNRFRYFESGSPFEYELIRYISTTSRQLQIDAP